MKSKIAVGLDSTLDIVITFPELEQFKEFSLNYSGELYPHIRRGYETIAEGSGGEVPIDGKRTESEKLLEEAKNQGAEINYALGGNGAQEAVTLERLGPEAIFLGGIFPKSLSQLPQKYQKTWKSLDTEFARTYSEYSPASYILQAPETNRYILTEGKGRRVDQLRPFLKSLPEKIELVKKKYGRLDAISLVGWQVLFGNELSVSDFKLIKRTINSIREKTNALLFTDAGGIGSIDKQEKNRLCRIYSLFDTLPGNEDEIISIADILSQKKENVLDEINAMEIILEESNKLSSVWLHTPDYQSTLTSKYEKDILEKAQKNAALGGLYKVESGEYPTMKDIVKMKDNRSVSKKGLRESNSLLSRYESKTSDKILASTPCYEPEKFISTVGAGDVSSATYLHSIVSQTKEKMSQS